MITLHAPADASSRLALLRCAPQRTSPTTVGLSNAHTHKDGCSWVCFFGHRPNFLNDRKKLRRLGRNVWKGRLVNAATASFNDITGQMTEMSQRRKTGCGQSYAKVYTRDAEWRDCKVLLSSNLKVLHKISRFDHLKIGKAHRTQLSAYEASKPIRAADKSEK